MQPYQVPACQTQAEITEKRSRFIGQVWPVSSLEQVQEILAELRRQHYQARHIVYAVRLHQPETARFSDDGEPQGTAGPPLLELLQRKDMQNCLITVVRYFGGVLLGTGGLLRAYTQAGQAALQQTGTLWNVPALAATIRADYAAYGRVAAFPARFGGTVGTVEYGEQVQLPFVIPALCEQPFSSADIWRETGATLSQWQPAAPLCMTDETFSEWKGKFL